MALLVRLFWRARLWFGPTYRDPVLGYLRWDAYSPAWVTWLPFLDGRRVLFTIDFHQRDPSIADRQAAIVTAARALPALRHSEPSIREIAARRMVDFFDESGVETVREDFQPGLRLESVSVLDKGGGQMDYSHPRLRGWLVSAYLDEEFRVADVDAYELK